MGEHRIAGILIPAQDHQFRAGFIKRMEIPSPSHHFLRVPVCRYLKILLGQVGQELVSVIKTVGHMQRYILLMPFLIPVRRVGIEVGSLTAVQHIHGAATLDIFTKATLPFYETLYGRRHSHIDIQHGAHTDGSLCYTRIVAYLNLGYIFRLHLA